MRNVGLIVITPPFLGQSVRGAEPSASAFARSRSCGRGKGSKTPFHCGGQRLSHRQVIDFIDDQSILRGARSRKYPPINQMRNSKDVVGLVAGNP
jgi:hypothetical protein